MAYHKVIYGRISCPTWKTDDFYRLHRINIEIINALPETDLDFPFINKSMFSFPNEQGIFSEFVITFGASYKSLEYDWKLWLEKFEKILRKLFWTDVIIHTEFELIGKFHFTWEADLNQIGTANWYNENPKPLSTWNFESNGPRSFKS